MKIILSFCLLHAVVVCFAQDTTSFKPYGVLAGSFFGDYAYKLKADPLKRGNLEYSKLPADEMFFNIRRMYLNYSYFLSPHFTTELLLSYEGSSASSSSRTLSIKYMNLRWKNILPRTDLVFGQMATPTFGLTERTWGYRAVEKTIANLHNIASFNDLGVALQGRFNKNETIGYNLLLANGSTGTENEKYKKIYTNWYGKLLDEKLIVDLNFNDEMVSGTGHKSRQTYKVAVSYKMPHSTIGAEAFDDEEKNFAFAYQVSTSDTLRLNLSQRAQGVSFFAKTNLSKKVTTFLRYDFYNPDKLFSSHLKYIGAYNFNTECFFTTGIDFQPIEKVHFIPNVWYNHYHSKTGVYPNGNDIVARCTLYVMFK